MLLSFIGDAILDNRYPEPKPLDKVAEDTVDQALRAHYTRCEFSERVNFTLSYIVRWIAWTFALATSVAVVLAQGTGWAKHASVLPIISTALLGLEATEPFMARSGWNYTYKNKLERLIVELLEGKNASEVERKRLDLREEMGKSYPHWRISHSGSTPS